MHRPHSRPDPRAAPAKTEHGAPRLFDDHHLGVGLSYAEAIKRDLQRFGNGLPSCLHPLHCYRGLPRRRGADGSDPDAESLPLGALPFCSFGPVPCLVPEPLTLPEVESGRGGFDDASVGLGPAGLAPGGFCPPLFDPGGLPAPFDIPGGRPFEALVDLVP